MNDEVVVLPDAEAEVFGRRLYCEEELGLDWSIVEVLPEPRALIRLNARNEVVLRTLALVEEHDDSQSDDAERAEIHRLEAKLNMVLELLAELVASRDGAIPTRLVRFNGRGFCWRVTEAIQPETLMLLECYPLPAWPVPLKLHARVVLCEQIDAQFQICARLEGLSDGTRNWMEKLVFRHHRQFIAQRRAAR